jgi:hypothetical protein
LVPSGVIATELGKFPTGTVSTRKREIFLVGVQYYFETIKINLINNYINRRPTKYCRFDLTDIRSLSLRHIILIKDILMNVRFLKMDEIRTTNQVEEVNKHLKEVPKEADERRIENQPQTGKNEKAIEPF